MSSTWIDLLGAKIDVGGKKYRGRYAEAGAGEPLILLHGQGGYIENFTRNIMVAAQYFHVYALDCVWHGLGPKPPFNPELVPTYVDQVIDFMDWAGIDSAHIAGQSMGGWTAMRLAHGYPERVKKLVLATVQGFKVEAPGMPEMEPTPNIATRDLFLKFLQDPSYENIKGRMTVLFAQPETRLPEEAIQLRKKVYSDPVTNKTLIDVLMSYMGGAESPCRKHVMHPKDLAAIKAPTMVYWAENNPVPPPYGKALADAIPGAQYYCNPDTGHWAQYENADDHNREVLRFLTGDASLNPPGYESVPLPQPK